jgi:hypothetical protein
MSFLRLVKYKEPYVTLLPLMTIYSTILGINVGMMKNTRNNDAHSFEMYSNFIGYTGLGIITGITYPISYPLFGCYVLYNNRK